MTRAPDRALLVTDIDNTLFDWVSMWYHSFSSMLNELTRISGVDAEILKSQIRAIHQRVETSEYSFLIQEIPALRIPPGTNVLRTRYASAVEAYRAARRETMVPYAGVIETLGALSAHGVRIVCYTESKAFHAASRVRELGLDGLVDALYSPADHFKPPELDLDAIRTKEPESYELRMTQHRYTPAGHFKPDPVVLEAIVAEFGRERAQIAYVGDSLAKDVSMAQAVGVIDVHAAYGIVHDSKGYALLREVSHWSNEDVERERELLNRPTVEPGIVVRSFDEVAAIFV